MFILVQSENKFTKIVEEKEYPISCLWCRTHTSGKFNQGYVRDNEEVKGVKGARNRKLPTH